MRFFAGLCNISLCNKNKILLYFINKSKTFMIFTKPLIFCV